MKESLNGRGCIGRHGRRKEASLVYAISKRLKDRRTAPLRHIQKLTALGMPMLSGLPDALSSGVLRGDFGWEDVHLALKLGIHSLFSNGNGRRY